MLWFETTPNLQAAARIIPRRRYGIIHIEEGVLRSISFRPWPKVVSRLEIAFWGRRVHGGEGDRCRLFYNFPVATPGFLTLAYIESTGQTRWATVRRCLEVLDWVAECRGAVATVCELSNQRISDRLMTRLGWERHCPKLNGRHFIKRFYSRYPQHDWLPAVTRESHFLRNRLPLRNESPDVGRSLDDSGAGIGLVDEPAAC